MELSLDCKLMTDVDVDAGADGVCCSLEEAPKQGGLCLTCGFWFWKSIIFIDFR